MKQKNISTYAEKVEHYEVPQVCGKKFGRASQPGILEVVYFKDEVRLKLMHPAPGHSNFRCDGSNRHFRKKHGDSVSMRHARSTMESGLGFRFTRSDSQSQRGHLISNTIYE